MKLKEYLIDKQEELAQTIDDGIRSIVEIKQTCDDVPFSQMEVQDILRTIAGMARNQKIFGKDANGRYIFNPKETVEKIYISWLDNNVETCEQFQKLTDRLILILEKINNKLRGKE
jgi:hypothetical protein